MIKSVTVFQKQDKSDAFTMVLTDPTNVSEVTGFAIDKIDGLGPVEADINTTEMVTDGDQFNSARVGKRNIVLDLIFYSETGVGIEEVRQRSYQLFPIKKTVYLEIEADNRTVWTKGYVEKNEPEIFSNESKTQVSIICPDPKLYDSDLVQISTILPGTELSFNYPGEVETGGILELRVNASVVAPVHDGVPAFMVSCVCSQADPKSIDIFTPNGGFVQGDVIKISSVSGDKSCIWTDTADADINALNLLNQNPDWITLNPGVNNIRVDDPNSALEVVTFTNKVCYEGV